MRTTMPEPEPTTRRWTRAEYYSMGELGLFQGQRVELIEGEIIVMSPQNPPHSSSSFNIAEILRDGFGPGYCVRQHSPLSLPGDSDPEPDVAVVKGGRKDFYDTHPSTAELVIEISGSSLNTYRTRKASLYAQAGIQDYWIVNLSGRCVEVFRSPGTNAAGQFCYASIEIFDERSFVSPLAKQELKIAVADLLPPVK